MDSLEGKIAVVTGGSRGIGAAIVTLLAARGARVTFTFREQASAAAAVVDEVNRHGGTARAVQVEVANATAVARLMDDVITTYGHLDVLVNNAGVFGARGLEDIDFSFFAEQFHTNVWGTIQVTQAALPHFPVTGGRIINLSSQRMYSPKDRTGVYAAAKGAITVLTHAFAIELGPRAITVNAVAPSVTRTEMTAAMPAVRKQALAEATPLGRVGEPGDVARIVAFLASDDAAWITGRTILADGGLT